MRVGVQFTGSLPANSTRRWFTHSWPATWHVAWYCLPKSPANDGPAQLEWKVKVCRQTSTKIKYFIEAKNLTGRTLQFEARYAILNR